MLKFVEVNTKMEHIIMTDQIISLLGLQEPRRNLSSQDNIHGQILYMYTLTHKTAGTYTSRGYLEVHNMHRSNAPNQQDG